METITIKDIARICGVGVTTVSRAMNNHPDISPRTKEHILKVIAENNYVPNNSARNLKRTETKTIAILVKALDNPFFSKMIRVLEKEIHNRKYNFFLQHIDESQDEIAIALELEKERKLQGIVFLGGRFLDKEKQLEQISVPFVLSTIGAAVIPKDSLGATVAVDDAKESFKVVDYLCELGHKKIAILAASEEDKSIGALRVRGYADALEKNGIPLDEKLIYHMNVEDEPYSMKSGYEMTKRLLESKTEFTAIYGISDMVAIGACKAIFESGRKIPEDCSVAGFDGLSQTYYYEPSITTMKQPTEEIARASTDVLFQMIKKKKKVQNKFFEAELVKRKSTSKI